MRYSPLLVSILASFCFTSCAGPNGTGGPNTGALLGAGAGAILGHGDLTAITDGATNGRRFSNNENASAGGQNSGQVNGNQQRRPVNYSNSQTGKIFGLGDTLFGQ